MWVLSTYLGQIPNLSLFKASQSKAQAANTYHVQQMLGIFGRSILTKQNGALDLGSRLDLVFKIQL